MTRTLNRHDDPDAVWGPPAPGRYCPAKVCWCGHCPWYVPLAQARPLTPERYTAVDRAAIASGKRRSTPAAYRQAQREMEPLVRPRRVRVTLTAAECQAAITRGDLMHEYARSRGFKITGVSSRETAILGCHGEYAISRWCGVPVPKDWTWEADKARGWDVAGWGIRTVSGEGYGLNLKTGDDGPFILVLGHQARRGVLWLAGTFTLTRPIPRRGLVLAEEGAGLGHWREWGVGDRDWYRVDQTRLSEVPDPPRPARGWRG
jgi:hypothetical protein